MEPTLVRADTRVEDVVHAFPRSVGWFQDTHGIRVICCGEPVWATLGEIARSHRVDPAALVEGLRGFLAEARG